MKKGIVILEKGDRYIADILFRIKILQYKGQAFEDFFVFVMTKAEPNFQPVKAYGNIGDRKNDGFVSQTGIYYQVYAPRDVNKEKTVGDAVKKLETDFKGLYDKWRPAMKSQP